MPPVRAGTGTMALPAADPREPSRRGWRLGLPPTYHRAMPRVSNTPMAPTRAHRLLCVTDGMAAAGLAVSVGAAAWAGDAGAAADAAGVALAGAGVTVGCATLVKGGGA